MTKILKTYLTISGEGIVLMDTIQVNGQRWIVPEWIDGYPTEGFSRPARMIRIDLLPQSELQGQAVLRDPIPKDVLDGETAGQFDVEFLPSHFVEFGSTGWPN